MTKAIFIRGFRPVIHARRGRMLGMRNPLEGPVVGTIQDAIASIVGVMANHFDRGLGLFDARIKRFEGLVRQETSPYRETEGGVLCPHKITD